jgi:hypothetical protein
MAYLSEDHVEMLIIGVEATLQLPLIPHLHVDPLVQGQPRQVMDQIYIKIPSPQCRLFLKTDQ